MTETPTQQFMRHCIINKLAAKAADRTRARLESLTPEQFSELVEVMALVACGELRSVDLPDGRGLLVDRSVDDLTDDEIRTAYED
jgi:hypothetical protein